MGKLYNISIIGAGNVGWHLAQDLEKVGHRIIEVFSRDKENAKRLCKHLYNATATDQLDFSKSKAELFLVCITDDALAEVAYKIKLPENAHVAHTSGTVSLDVFSLSPNKGVFYPLQSFTEGRKINFEEIPICIEANNNETEQILTEVGISISKYIHYLSSDKRKALHVAAVFASNFTNHLLGIAKDILNKESIEFEILRALVNETVDKAFAGDPKEMQTGPAVRNDQNVLDEHIKFLKDSKDLKEIYKILSNSIIKIAEE